MTAPFMTRLKLGLIRHTIVWLALVHRGYQDRAGLLSSGFPAKFALLPEDVGLGEMRSPAELTCAIRRYLRVASAGAVTTILPALRQHPCPRTPTYTHLAFVLSHLLPELSNFELGVTCPRNAHKRGPMAYL